MKKLTMQEVGVLCMRYGLHGSETLTLREVGEKMGSSRQNICAVEKRALKKLRNHPKLKDLTYEEVFGDFDRWSGISSIAPQTPFANRF